MHFNRLKTYVERFDHIPTLFLLYLSLGIILSLVSKKGFVHLGLRSCQAQFGMIFGPRTFSGRGHFESFIVPKIAIQKWSWVKSEFLTLYDIHIQMIEWSKRSTRQSSQEFLCYLSYYTPVRSPDSCVKGKMQTNENQPFLVILFSHLVLVLKSSHFRETKLRGIEVQEAKQ